MLYLDSSAIVKLIVPEPETDALLALLTATTAPLVSSQLTYTEVSRAVLRWDPSSMTRVDEVLERIFLLSLDTLTLRRAGQTLPPDLRTLDAIHLTAATRVPDYATTLISYDRRLLQAAVSMELPTSSPGADEALSQT